jgi:hypothetical protein
MAKRDTARRERAREEKRDHLGVSRKVMQEGKKEREFEKISESESPGVVVVGEEEDANETFTKSQRKELKRQQNLEWKWKRGEVDPNPRHTEYYRRQLPELSAEWPLFQETMAKDLPVTFRLSTERNAFVCSRLKAKFLSEVCRLAPLSRVIPPPPVPPHERKVHHSP